MTLRVDAVVHDAVTVIFAALWNGLVADFRRQLLQQLDHVLCGQPVVVRQMGDPYGSLHLAIDDSIGVLVLVFVLVVLVAVVVHFKVAVIAGSGVDVVGVVVRSMIRLHVHWRVLVKVVSSFVVNDADRRRRNVTAWHQ